MTLYTKTIRNHNREDDGGHCTRETSIGCDIDAFIFNEEHDADKALMTIVAAHVGGDVFVPENGGAIDVTGSPTEKAILSWGVKVDLISLLGLISLKN